MENGCRCFAFVIGDALCARSEHGSDGDGTFQPAVSFTTAAYPLSVGIGDFTGDGLLDIAVGDVQGNVEIYLNAGGTFTPNGSVKITFPPNEVTKVRAGNLNGNGVVDLAGSTNDSALRALGRR